MLTKMGENVQPRKSLIVRQGNAKCEVKVKDRNADVDDRPTFEAYATSVGMLTL